MLAKEVMEKNVVTVSPDMTLEEAAELMVRHNISGIPVMDGEGRVIGVVSELDLIRKQIKPREPELWQLCAWGLSGSRKLYDYQKSIHQWRSETVREIMTDTVISVEEEEDIETVGRIMFDRGIKRVIVTKDGKMTGILSRSELVRTMFRRHLFR